MEQQVEAKKSSEIPQRKGESSPDVGSLEQDLEQRQHDADIQCPPSTTERRLMTKIDFHVVPFLCVMYLLAFLGMKWLLKSLFSLSASIDPLSPVLPHFQC